MSDWLKANGGPPAIVLAGLFLIALNPYLGISVASFGIVYWIYKASWFPLTIAKKKEVVAMRGDAEIIKQARNIVGSIGSLLSQHVRFKPPIRDENEEDIGSYKAWAKGVNRSNTHDQSTTARFFEDYYEDLMTVVSSLHNRGALTQEEVKQINWWIGTSTLGGGLTHNLADIPPLIATAADRLESGNLFYKAD